MTHFYKLSLKLLSASLLFIACSTPRQGVLTSHRSTEKNKNEELSLKPKTKRKISPDDKALNAPLPITLPYKESSYFENTDIPANGYSFIAKKGQRLLVTVTSLSDPHNIIYTQLWEKDSDPSLIGSANAGDDTLAYDFEKDGNYIIRVESEKQLNQPYTVMITTGPSFVFPINKKDKPRMSSFWGASRDNGARSHEGIDIVAKKYTPVVAVADGYITAVKNGGLGGKTISLRPDKKDFSVYYAHLDQQFVKQGEYVHAGDTLGTVGNTGNAAKTVPHLHFGIYSMAGAIDPFAFINPDIPDAKPVKSELIFSQVNGKIKSATTLYSLPTSGSKKSIVQSGTVKLLAATDNYYRVRLENGIEGYMLAGSVVKELVQAKEQVAQTKEKTIKSKDKISRM
jgi:peptidoglycan LD-endopeptidase LytH